MVKNTNCDTPLDWMFGNETSSKWNTPWPTIEDYSDDDEYYELDKIFRTVIDGRAADESHIGQPIERLKDEYKKRFPIMLGQTLKNIGDAILNGKIKLNVLFPGDRGYHSEEK